MVIVVSEETGGISIAYRNSLRRKLSIKELEAEMLQAAKDLEFERAAVLRDEIKNIREMRFDG